LNNKKDEIHDSDDSDDDQDVENDIKAEEDVKTSSVEQERSNTQVKPSVKEEDWTVYKAETGAVNVDELDDSLPESEEVLDILPEELAHSRKNRKRLRVNISRERVKKKRRNINWLHFKKELR
jgi:hypothetical protein